MVGGVLYGIPSTCEFIRGIDQNVRCIVVTFFTIRFGWTFPANSTFKSTFNLYFREPVHTKTSPQSTTPESKSA